jgi:PAS domain S-box-containing protein
LVYDQQQLLLNEKNSRIRLLTAAVEQSANSIIITTPHGDIEYVNPHFCATTGYMVDEVFGQKPWIFNSETESVENNRDIWQAVSSGGRWAGEFLNRRKSGELYWEQATISPVFDDNGSITSLIAIMVDITARKEAEDEMRQAKEQAEAANRAKSEFLANMSHEIRTPMNGVIGMAQMLELTELNEEQLEYTNLLIESGNKLMSLINDILDLSKIEVGRIEIEKKDFDLQEMSQSAFNLLSLHAHENGLEFISRIDPDVPLQVKGDSVRLRQILINLLGNAIKFTPKGTVTLHIQKYSENETYVTVRFMIRDTGIGISADKLSMIFAPFTQADSSSTRSYGGTGLGLTISRHLAELMCGNIDVESVEGEGSTFWFDVVLEKQAQVLGVTQGCPDPVDHEGSLQKKVQNGNGTRLLLVEDDPTNQVVIKASLTKFGYHVDVVNDGSEAIKALENNDYALVLMDCMMPVLNGYEATAVIRNQASAVRNHEIPVIALTAKAFEEDRDKCQAAGMNDFLSKPVIITDLLIVLGKWVPFESAPGAIFQ